MWSKWPDLPHHCDQSKTQPFLCWSALEHSSLPQMWNFYPKESLAISIQSTGRGPHLKAIYLSQRNLVLLGLNLSRQSDPIIKIILAKSDCFQSSSLLHRPKLFAYEVFFFSPALSEPSSRPMFHAWKHTWCFLSVTGKTIQSRKVPPTRHFTLGVVFSYASCCTISLVIQTRLPSGTIFNLLITFW